MTREMIIGLVVLFTITSFTNILATLKTILVSKKIMNPVYIVVFVDAIIFASVLTKVVESKGLYYTIAYAFGRTFGVFMGGKIEERLALGIIEVDLFVSQSKKMITVAEKLRIEGYTVNNQAVWGMNGTKRHKLEIVMKRKDYKYFEQILSDFGINNPTLKIKNISKVTGKINVTNAVNLT